MKKLSLLVIMTIMCLGVWGQNPTSSWVEETSTNSASYNLKNAIGRWHITGPRSYEKYNTSAPNNNLSIFWRKNGDSYKRYFTILDNGNLGIGTPLPGNKLAIADGDNQITINPGTIQGIGFNRSVKSGDIYNKNISAWQFTARHERFSLEGYNGVENKLLNILRNGYVGIGIIEPKAKLDILQEIITSETNLCKGLVLRKSRKLTAGDVNQISFSINNNAGEAQSIIRSITTDSGDGTGRFEICTRHYSNGQYTGQQIPWIADFSIDSKGNVGIGKIPEGNTKLDVCGTIRAKEVKVEEFTCSNGSFNGTLAANNITVKANGNTADFVFEENYDLKNLKEIEAYIKTNKHLPNIPSAAQMEEQGVNLAEMNKLLLQKVEELTLYSIGLEKKDNEIRALMNKKDEEVENQKIKVEGLEKALYKERSARSQMEERVLLMKKELETIKTLILNK